MTAATVREPQGRRQSGTAAARDWIGSALERAAVCITDTIRRAISSPAESTNENTRPRYPNGAHAHPNQQPLGLSTLCHRRRPGVTLTEPAS
jgi:hypothetical protein